MNITGTRNLTKNQMKRLLARVLEESGGIRPSALKTGEEVIGEETTPIANEVLGMRDIHAAPEYRGTMGGAPIGGRFMSGTGIEAPEKWYQEPHGITSAEEARLAPGGTVTRFGIRYPSRPEVENQALMQALAERMNVSREVEPQLRAGQRPILGETQYLKRPIMGTTPSEFDVLRRALTPGSERVMGRLYKPSEEEHVPAKVIELPIEEARAKWKAEVEAGHPEGLKPEESYLPSYERFTKGLARERVRYQPITLPEELKVERRMEQALKEEGVKGKTEAQIKYEDVPEALQVWKYMTGEAGRRSLIGQTWKTLLSGSDARTWMKDGKDYFVWCYTKWRLDSTRFARKYPREARLLDQISGELNKATPAP